MITACIKVRRLGGGVPISHHAIILTILPAFIICIIIIMGHPITWGCRASARVGGVVPPLSLLPRGGAATGGVGVVVVGVMVWGAARGGLQTVTFCGGHPTFVRR